MNMQSKGGHARAAALSPERRSQISSQAAKVRWEGAGTMRAKKGRRLAPRVYKELPEYLAPKIVDDPWLSPSPMLRNHTIRVVREIIAKALEARE